MDPKATYDLLVRAINDKDWEAATEAARNLYNWIVGGGFPPDCLRIDMEEIPTVEENKSAAGLSHLVRAINHYLLKPPAASRDEIFDRLAALGVAKVKLSFSGGGDEGQVDEIECFDAEGKFVSGEEIDAVLTEMDEEMEKPIFDKFGGFDGGFDVAGELTWDVENRKVKIGSQVTDWIDQGEHEV